MSLEANRNKVSHRQDVSLNCSLAQHQTESSYLTYMWSTWLLFVPFSLGLRTSEIGYSTVMVINCSSRLLFSNIKEVIEKCVFISCPDYN